MQSQSDGCSSLNSCQYALLMKLTIADINCIAYLSNDLPMMYELILPSTGKGALGTQCILSFVTCY